jgi:tRNA(adenine34) deaminase
MVSDTPYDAESSSKAGVVCLGLTCGGHPQQELISSCARAVWRDSTDLLAHLDEALKQASPDTAHSTQDMLDTLMHEALAAASFGMNAGEVRIGAVIARGFNELNATGNKTAHAEIDAFARAAGKIPPEARDTILVSTLEPCVMCLGASMVAAVDTVSFGLRAPADRGTSRVRLPQSPDSQMPRIIGDVLADHSRALLRDWMHKPDRNPQQVAFVKQLLELTQVDD